MADPWIVLKFGGTSVSTAERWGRIATRIRELLPEHRVWVVASAISQVSDHLELCLDEALHDIAPDSLRWIQERHHTLALELGLDATEFAPVAEVLEDLGRLLEGARLTREASPRLRARVMASGELASTRLGIAALARHDLRARWVDARHLLRSEARERENEPARYLDADIPPRRDPEGAEAEAIDARLVLTQGFIASTSKGEACLLGRGGSDTSAALFAALLSAQELEIWTDVHGMFTADPRQIPVARLIRKIGYREAQELAAMGAKVLHPRCLAPLAWAGIPLSIRNTLDPDTEGTHIGDHEDAEPAVMAVVCRRGVTLISLATLAMWESAGFLARAFAPFEELGISVDLVATSQSAVSVTLDRIPGGLEGEPFAVLLHRLRSMGEVQVIHPCAVVSIVGRRIRTVLHELGPALSVFQEHEVHMVSESSEDLNLSFVVDEEDAEPLVASLHARLLPPQGPVLANPRFGPTWELLSARRESKSPSVGSDPRTVPSQTRLSPSVKDPSSKDPSSPEVALDPRTDAAWWRRRRDLLLRLSSDGRARYVYDLETLRERARRLRRHLPSVDRFYYSVKANPHPRILEAVTSEGFGLECVSAAEVLRAREIAGPRVPILFTPNFCPLGEYEIAWERGAEVTIDGPEVLDQAPELFAGRELALRIDPGSGLGHHESVRTAGPHAKFGHPIPELSALLEATARCRVRVIGLHAHLGSGIFDSGAWERSGEVLASLRSRFQDLRWIDLGGGFGVVERPGQAPLDLDQVEAGLGRIQSALAGDQSAALAAALSSAPSSIPSSAPPSAPSVALRMEPGRYLVSEAGVLLAPVTQIRSKGNVRFAGVATGMNSLIRPALYGAWHPIHNLTRIEETPTGYWHVVGPICETGDVLGRDRLLPDPRPGDVLLIENCGAYGAAMSSHYNLRAPAEEVVLEDPNTDRTSAV